MNCIKIIIKNKGIIMKIFKCFLLVLFSTPFLFSQWSWQNPLPQGNNLNKVFFVDSTFGWVAGNSGTIINTTNGGTDWSVQKSGTTINLTGIFFLNKDLGWAVGPQGYNGSIIPSVLLQTSDGGENWTEVNTELDPNTVSFNTVFFLNNLTGFIAGNKNIFKTTDGGKNWNTVEDAGSYVNLKSIYFSDNMNGWVVGSQGTILHTTDSGDSWNRQNSDTTSELNSIYFVDNQNGWISGYQGIILHTTNGGTNWNFQNSGGKYILSDIHFTDLNNGWIATNDNPANGMIVLHTTNGGTDWNQQTTETNENLNSLYFYDNKGWVVGDAGVIYKTTDDGNSWNTQTSGSTDDFLDVSFSDDSLGIAVGPADYANLTENSGNSWNKSLYNISLHKVMSNLTERQIVKAVSNAKLGLKKIHPFLSLSNGQQAGLYISISFSSEFHKKLSTYSLDSLSWQQRNINTAQNLWALSVVDTSNIWVAGDSGVVLYTSDFGNSWDKQNSGVTSTLWDAFFTDSLNGWIVGYNGTIINTTDGGQNWNTQQSGTQQKLWSVHFLDILNGWVVGDAGTILHTIDGGTNWTPVPSNTYNNLRSIDFSDEMNGWIVGQGGIILNTGNGGQTWNLYPSITTNDLLAVDFVDNNNGWAVGTGGTIIHFSGNATGIKINQTGNISTSFKLEQNYPNPFNPTTTINYNIPKTSYVTLKVYDILGNVVKTIVDKEQRAGSYNVQFAVGNRQLASGIYFYQLSAGSFIQSKKMILLK